MRRIRCAIYTRKSTKEGLEQEFNSLDAQREACEAYIASQKHEGWELIDRAYDDGGISGGHLDRPALQRLMQDVDDKQVDQIVVYKIDRLTRSLADFSRLVDRLDAAEASFVSVTQSFNTGTSMGRLTLNVLLSFAQFEREVTAERIRDKIAASKRRGLWMGGNVPLGYDADGRTLKINVEEAEAIRKICDLYEEHRALNVVAREAEQCGIRSRRRQTKAGLWRGGNVLSRGHIHYILTSPIYAGRIPHKGRVHDGQHPAIIDPERWERIQEQLVKKAAVPRGSHARKTEPSPLTGKLFDGSGDRLSPSHSKKHGRRYRYYISRRLVTGRKEDLQGRGWRLPAEALEVFVLRAVQSHLNSRIGNLVRQISDPEAYRRVQKLSDDPGCLLPVVERVEIREGRLAIGLLAEKLAVWLETKAEGIDPVDLTFEIPFTMRRRGVETRFVMAGNPTQADTSLIANIARAHQWLDRIRKGETPDQIADHGNTTKKRIQQTLTFAFLAPDIVRDIITGKQPAGLTLTWTMTPDLLGRTARAHRNALTSNQTGKTKLPHRDTQAICASLISIWGSLQNADPHKPLKPRI